MDSNNKKERQFIINESTLQGVLNILSSAKSDLTIAQIVGVVDSLRNAPVMKEEVQEQGEATATPSA